MMTTPTEPKYKLGFRPHPGTLLLSRMLHPLLKTNTQLFMENLKGSLTLPRDERPTPMELRDLHEKILLLEEGVPMKVRTSKGELSLSNRYPLISIYPTQEEMAHLSEYKAEFPDFQTLGSIYRHSLFTLLIRRGATLAEITKVFNSLIVDEKPAFGRVDPFKKAAPRVRPTPKLAPPTPLKEEPTEVNPEPSTDDILSLLSDLLTPPLLPVDADQKRFMERFLVPGATHQFFPYQDWDYRPILEKALGISGGKLSGVFLQALGAFPGDIPLPSDVSTKTPS